MAEKHHLHMHDHRLGPDGTAEAADKVDTRFWSTLVEIDPIKIVVIASSPDGDKHEVWIEIAAGHLVAHCYDSQHDEPLNVRIGKGDIATDDDRNGEDICHA